jgi:two-component system, NtrC family, sensor kinase
MSLSQLLESSGGELKAELQLILNAVVEGLCGLGTRGNVTFCNDALLKMTGYRAEEIIGSNLHELLHHSRRDGTKYPAEECAARNAIIARQPIHIKGEFFWRKDGTCFPTEYWAHPLPQLLGATSVVVTIQDLTEIQQAKDILEQSEEKFRRILASYPDVAWTADRNGRTVYISPKVEAVFGYTKQEICAGGDKLRLGRIHSADFGRVLQAYGALFENQIPFDEEYRLRRKDGAWIWVHDRAMGTHEENGVLHTDGILSDITPRKQAEAKLQSQTAFLEAQANSTIDGILVVDGAGQGILLNQRFLELFKIPPELDKSDQALLKHVVSLIKDPEPFRAKIHHLNFHPKETSRDEIEFKDGMILDRYSAPVLDKNGIYYGRIWSFRDITERRRNEDRLRQLSVAVEQSPVSVVITDPQGNISYVNRKFTDTTGYSGDEVVGKNPRILNSGQTAPEVYRDLWSNITQGREWHGEFCNRKKNGEIYWAAATISPVINPKGTITHYLAVKEDITERKRAEEELYGSRQMLQSVLDAIPQRVFWKDGNSIYLGCNRAFATDAGLDAPAAIIGKSDFDLAWAGTAELYRADDKLVMEQGSAKLNFHEHQTRPDGSVLWLQTNKLPLRDREGKVTGVLGTYEDITERKRADKELRLTQFAVEHASDSIFRIGAEGRIFYVNEEAHRSSGYSREELLALSISHIAPHFPKEAWVAFWEEMKTRGSKTLETVHQTKQGKVFPVEITANYLELDGQEYVFSFVRDITDRSELESQLRQAQKLEGIGQLAAGIAHEINTPTQFVTDNLTFLRDSWEASHELLKLYRRTIRKNAGTLPPDVTAAIEQAEQGCDLDFIAAEVPHAIEQGLEGVRRVATIVRAMKEFSHPDSANKTAANLNQTIESTITVARNEWKYVAEIVTEFDETLPPVVCYPGDINQVILNLLVNAAHAIKEKIQEGEKGRITVRTRSLGESVEISVTDTGTGIPEAIRTRVFDPFFTTKEVGKGTGQGLSLAHSVVVKKHSGRIWLETESGIGSTFFIELPINRADPAPGS